MMSQQGNWIDQVLELSAVRLKVEQSFQCDVAKALECRKNKVAWITTQEEQLLAMSDDLVVLVRTSIGAPKEVYHLADQACGHARWRGFKKVLEGQAQAERLTRCSKCPWQAQPGPVGSAS